MVLGDLEDDSTCLEQGEIAFLIGGNLAETERVNDYETGTGSI